MEGKFFKKITNLEQAIPHVSLEVRLEPIKQGYGEMVLEFNGVLTKEELTKLLDILGVEFKDGEKKPNFRQNKWIKKN